MNIPLFISLLFGLQLFYWFVGRKSSMKIETQDDYFLAGKKVALFPLMMTFLATQVGGGIILGSANEAYLFGWPVLLYPMGAALGLILLGCSVGSKLAAFPVSTVAQVMEIAYGSAALKKLTSVLSIVSLFMILVAQIIASNKFLISMGMESSTLFVLFWAIVILYTSQGGLKAVISTDIAQAAFFSCVFVLCFGMVLFWEPAAKSALVPSVPDLTLLKSKWCGWLLMPLFFMVIEQDMGQRCFAGKCPKTVSKATLLSGLFTLLICIIPIFFGCFAMQAQVAVPKGGSVLMSAIEALTTPWMTALCGCAILAAIVSTATSLINAISSNISGDFNLSYSLKKIRTITALFSLGAILFAFFFDNVVDLLIQSYELSVSCLFVPIVMALYQKQKGAASATGAILAGAFGFVLFRIFPLDFSREIISLLFSFMGYYIGALASKKRPTLEEA